MPGWTQPSPQPHTGVRFGIRAPRGLGIYFASSVFFNVQRVNAVAAAVCVAILFVIESPTQDVSTLQPQEISRAQREHTPSPTPPNDPVSRSSIDLVMGSPFQDASKVHAEAAPNPHDDAVSTSSIDLVMGSPAQDTSKVQLVKPSNAQREGTSSVIPPPDDPVDILSSNPDERPVHHPWRYRMIQ